GRGADRVVPWTRRRPRRRDRVRRRDARSPGRPMADPERRLVSAAPRHLGEPGYRVWRVGGDERARGLVGGPGAEPDRAVATSQGRQRGRIDDARALEMGPANCRRRGGCRPRPPPPLGAPSPPPTPNPGALPPRGTSPPR